MEETQAPNEHPPAHDAPQAADDGLLRRVSPLDLRALPPVRAATPSEVDAAVARARAAQAGWASERLSDRMQRLRSAASAMLARRAEIVECVRRETGKTEVDALFTEALGPLETLSGWKRVLASALEERVRLNPLSFPHKRAHYALVPRGVIGVIAPWNYPVAGLYRSVFPALLTGNGVVVKPSEYTPESSAWFVERLAEALPEGLVQVVQGDGRVGAALLNAGIDACVFTGSTETGKRVRVRAAELGIPCSAEMGGNDAAIVLGDCDLPRTVAGLTHWALHNAGQACGAVEMVYADTRIADRLVQALAASFQRLTLGEGGFAEVDVAPLAHRNQLERVEAHVSDALDKGAKLVVGGRRFGRGLGYEPTLLDHCTDRMRVVQEETFGPVLAVVRVDGAADAIRRVNRGRYGLTASIWTRDTARAERLASRLSVGVVTVNNHSLTGAMPQLPWSGTRDSGFGIANSRWSLTTFARPKTVLVDRSSDPDIFWVPVDRRLYELGELLADASLKRFGRAYRIPSLLRGRVRALRRAYLRR